jgi:hypothetical protein
VTTNRAGVFADKNVGTGKTVTVSGYTMTGTDAANYALVQPAGVTADITALSLAVTGATAANKTYDQLLAAAITGGAIAQITGDDVTLVAANRAGVFADKNVGTGKSVTVSGYTITGTDAANYALVQPTGVTADITALSLAVTGATAANKTYDALLAAAITGGAIAQINGDDVTLVTTNRAGVFADKNVGTGKSVTVSGYSIAGTDAANYALVQPAGLTADITALSLAVTGATAANKTYDQLLTAAISGGTITQINGDDVTLVATNRAGLFADRNVGTGKSVTVSGYTITGTDAANYSLVQPTGVTADITALSLAVTGATAANKTYDRAPATDISGGFVAPIAGDDVTLLVVGRTGTFADWNVGTGKSVTVSGYAIAGVDAANYALVQPVGVTADITPLSLAVTGATAGNKTYDRDLAATVFGGAIAPLAGDDVNLVSANRAGTFADWNVGPGKSVAVSGYAIAGADAANYSLVQPTGVTADITPRSLVVTGVAASNKVYDRSLVAVLSGGSVAPLAGDAVALDGSAATGLFADWNVGNAKGVTAAGYALAGADAANYAIVQPTGLVADITPRSLAVTGVQVESKTSDGNANATLLGGGIAPFAGDAITLDLSFAVGVFLDGNVGVAKPVTASGYALAGIDAANYFLLQPTGLTGDITAVGGLLYPNVLPTAVVAAVAPAPTAWVPAPAPAATVAPTAAGVVINVSVMPMSTVANAPLPIGQMFSIAVAKPVALQKASLEVTAGFVPGRTILEVNAPPGLEVSVDNTKGVITISGKASSGDYERLLRGVTLRSAEGHDVDGLTLRVGLTDEVGSSQSRVIDLRRGDDAPKK